VLSPLVFDIKLSRAAETIIGIGLPLILLTAYELYARYKGLVAPEYEGYLKQKTIKKAEALISEEAVEVKRQNKFGLKVIAGSLVFVAAMLLALSLFTTSGSGITAVIGVVILLSAVIPWRASQKVFMLSETVPVQTVEH
jgi:hypothetical protein